MYNYSVSLELLWISVQGLFSGSGSSRWWQDFLTSVRFFIQTSHLPTPLTRNDLSLEATIAQQKGEREDPYRQSHRRRGEVGKVPLVRAAGFGQWLHTVTAKPWLCLPLQNSLTLILLPALQATVVLFKWLDIEMLYDWLVNS